MLVLGDVDEVAGGKREANAAQAVCCGDHRCSRPFIEQRSLGVRRRANVCELAGALPHADALPQLYGGSTLLPCARQTWERLTHALLRPSAEAATALSASRLRRWGTCNFKRGSRSALTHGEEVITNGRTVTTSLTVSHRPWPGYLCNTVHIVLVAREGLAGHHP